MNHLPSDVDRKRPTAPARAGSGSGTPPAEIAAVSRKPSAVLRRYRRGDVEDFAPDGLQHRLRQTASDPLGDQDGRSLGC